MKPFSYLRATSVETVLANASDRNRLLGGGIDLLGELKEGLTEAGMLVSITHIPGLDKIERTATGWKLGANVTLVALAEHAELKQALPGVAEAALEVGSPQIRNVATLGGNLAQHSRCWYYRHRDVKCLKKGGATCYAREGENKYHSLFSGNPCISPCVSNLGVALAALDATVLVQRRSGEARLSIADLYANAWINPMAHNSLAPGDMIVAVEIPVAQARCTYLQLSEKNDFDWALVSCAAAVELDGGVVRKARIAVGSVAPVPYRDERAEAALVGKKLDEATAGAAADILLEAAVPLTFNAYKVPMTRAAIKRALLKLVA